MENLLTLKEAAAYLNLDYFTVIRLAQSGKIPAVKVGGRWRVQKALLEKWLADQHRPRPAALLEEHGKKYILVVDDNPTIRENFQVALARKGHTVIAVPNGYEAIDQVKTQAFDVIFLNLFMPGINGLETFERIKALDSEARVVLITGYPEHELVGEILNYGPLVILRKPLRTDEIYSTVDMLTRRPRLP